MSDPSHVDAGAPAGWRIAAAAAPIVAVVAVVAGLGPVAQDQRYHAFADARALLGVPNAADVLSNLPFLLIGVAGVRHCLRARVGPMRDAWVALFAGIALVCAGSAYYHWSPSNATLAWDRLPMTLGFMGLFVALLGEYVDVRVARRLLPVAIALGLASVAYWRITGDLRPYWAVQLAPLASIPLAVVLLRGRYTHQGLLLAALGWYVLAKIAEGHDGAIFLATGERLSGHTLKHLLAAAACATLLRMLVRRTPLPPPRREPAGTAR